MVKPFLKNKRKGVCPKKVIYAGQNYNEHYALTQLFHQFLYVNMWYIVPDDLCF